MIQGHLITAEVVRDVSRNRSLVCHSEQLASARAGVVLERALWNTGRDLSWKSTQADAGCRWSLRTGQ